MVLLDELERFGCELVFLDRPMSDDPHDRLLLQIRSAVAEYERTLVTERMRRGRLSKYRAGTLLPWTKPPYGYRLHPDRPRDPAGVRIEETEAAVVQLIFERYAQEKTSLCGLAKYLQQQGILAPSGNVLWSLATLRGMLTQPAYTGTIYAQRYRYKPSRVRRSATHPMGKPHQSTELTAPEDWILVATIPALIELEQFQLVAAKLKQNRSFAVRNNKRHEYLLRALVSCGHCQSSCTARSTGTSKHRYYVCAAKGKAIHSRGDKSQTQPRVNRTPGFVTSSRKLEKCSSRFAPAAQLDEIVWQDLCDVLLHPGLIRRNSAIN
jgi:site-specific DNA recombinase